MKLTALGFSVLIALASVNPALANLNTSFSPSGAAITPINMQYFCKQNPSECRKTRDAKIELTDEMVNMLRQVNVSVNRAIRPRLNVPGGWKLNPAAGDCNDYVLSKRSQLIQMGVPAGALRFAVTKTRRGQPHAVLVVRSSSGDIVLDNLSSRVVTLQQSGYLIRSMSSADPLRWHAG